MSVRFALAACAALIFLAVGTAKAQTGVSLYCISGYTSTGAAITAPCTTANPVPVTRDAASNNLNNVNQTIAVTGTAVQLTTVSMPLINGLTCAVIAAGTNKVSIGRVSTVTNPQTVTFSSSAVGTYLVNAQTLTVAINNASMLFINGTAGDGVTCWGN